MSSDVPDLAGLTSEPLICGEDAEETAELGRMLAKAKNYLLSHKWCPGIGASYLGLGEPGVLAVFLFKLSKAVPGVDQWLWVIEGDLPSAYLVLDQAPDPRAALGVYCSLMEEWVAAVKTGKGLDQVFPVAALPKIEYADMLAKRIAFIRKNFLDEASE